MLQVEYHMPGSEKTKYRPVEYLRRRRNDPARRQQAIREARTIARFLKERYSAQVFGIGSLFQQGRSFSLRSDIDLVVKGLPDREFISICAEAAQLTQLSVDIIPYQDANELVLETVKERAVEL